MISVILMEPQTPGNVGAVARAMANFDFKDLVIVNPQCDVLDEEALKRAKHAGVILRKAKIIKKNDLKRFDYLIGTTARLGTDYNIPRSPLTPLQLADKLRELNAKKSKNNLGLLFGREGDGLSNEEIALCDFTVSIETSAKYSAMNLSHAVSIVLYELSKKGSIGEIFPSATNKDKQLLEKNANEIIDALAFSTKEKKETQKILWKKIIGKSFLTKREAMALFGFFKKLKRKR